jgi:RNA polymerase sigma-70 factor (ECF subfamily)
MSPRRPDDARRGAPEAFRRFATEVAPLLAGYFRRRLYPLSPADVDELVNDTLLVMWRRWADVPAEAEIPWAIGVARHVLSNAQRSHRRRHAMEGRLVPTGERWAAEDAVVADVALAEALSSLSEADRDIIILSAWDGLTVTQLAQYYAISDNAATVRLSRAHARLDEKLREGERIPDERTEDQR